VNNAGLVAARQRHYRVGQRNAKNEHCKGALAKCEEGKKIRFLNLEKEGK